MTRLADLVATSQTVAGTSGRLAKVAALAALLRRLAPEEIEIGVAYLSGETRQGKLGLGYAALRDAGGGAAASGDPLMLAEVDAALERLRGTTGKGSAAARAAQLAQLFARATADERDFLARLIVGELRQGALEGVMVDAIASAAELPVADVRRAAMSAGGAGGGRAAALTEGAAGLARFAIRLHAAGAADARAAGGRRRGRARRARRGRARVEARRRARPGPQGRRRGARLHAQPERRHRRGAGDRRGGARRCRRAS